MLTFAAVIIARKTHSHLPRSYKVPLYPITPIIAIGGALYVFYGMLSTQPMFAAFSIGLTLAGLPVFYYMQGESKGAALSRIKTKYIVTGAALIILTLLTLSARVFDARPEICVGTEPSSPPFAYEDKGKLVGYDVELIQMVAERAGYKVTYRTITLNNLFDALQQGYIDVAIDSLSITPERQQLVSFTKPYITNGGIALLTNSNSSIKSIADLNGKTVGVYKGSTSETYAGNLSGVNVQTFYAEYDMVQAFKQRQIDCIIYDRPILEYFLSHDHINNAVIIQNISQESYGIAFSSSNKELGNKLNKALAELQKSGELDILYQRWLK